MIKSQWEQALGASADPEHHNLFDAGTKESRRALIGHGHGGCPHKKKKKHHHHHHHHHHGGDVSLSRRIWHKIRRTTRRCADRLGLGLARFRRHDDRTEHEYHRGPPSRHGREHRGPHHGPPHHRGPHGPQHDGTPRVWTDTYYSLLNYPVKAALSLTPPGADEPSWRAKLREDVFPEDPTSGDGVGIWHGFSKNGTVKGQLVYASRGTKEDFEYLAQQGEW